MALAVLIGIDIGQSACKVSAIDADGRLLATASHPYPTVQVAAGQAEQDPDLWISAAACGCREVIADTCSSVEAVCVTAATHNAVLLDGASRPVRPCITLRDTRPWHEAQLVEKRSGQAVLAHARNGVSAGWTLPQLRWIRNQDPAAWARTRRLALAKDYVRSALTGDSVTDWIDAEGTLLLDPATHRWDERLCALVPLDTAWLPEPVAPTQVVGSVTTAAARATGIQAGTPVVAGCSDTAAELLAAGAVRPSDGVLKIATAGNVNVVVDRPRPSTRYFTYSHPITGLTYHSYGTSSAAASRAWLHATAGAPAEDPYDRMDALAAVIPPGADGLVFHPYLHGERAPVFDATLRASFVGLSGRHTRAHLERAVLEGVALSLAECAESAAADGLRVTDFRLIGGGARSRLWRQVMADVLNRPLIVPRLGDASTGAALLAGVGCGIFSSARQAVDCCVDTTSVVQPDPASAGFYAELLHVYREVRSVTTIVGRRLQQLSAADGR